MVQGQELGRRVDVYRDLKEECHIHRVESPVKWHRFHIQKHRDDVGAAAADIDGLVDDPLVALGKVHPKIFQAVFVAAGIVNSACVDANGLFKASRSIRISIAGCWLCSVIEEKPPVVILKRLTVAPSPAAISNFTNIL